MPESSVALSIGTLMSIAAFVYMFIKDSKETTQKISKLEAEVEQLKTQKQDIKDLKKEIDSVKSDVNQMSQTLARVDTNITHLMQSQN